MERRGRIPVARFRTQEGKTRSRSRVRDPDYNEQDPETDLFTLLEDNIALKEENKALKIEIENGKKTQNELEEKETKVREELDALKKQHLVNETQIKELTVKFNKLGSERNALDKLHKIKIEKISSLENELQSLQEKLKQKLIASTPPPPPSPPAFLNVAVAPIASASLSSKLLKIIPTLSSGEMESIVDVEPTAALPITSDLVERLVDEFQTLKNSMNAVELQLYEANEKIAELLENQHHLEEENETLRTENTNLTKVAKLLTENMKESVETSKKMEAALIKLKQRNDELNAKTRDITDGQPEPSPSPTTVKANEEFEQIKEEVESQNRDHNERIVEMKSLMEAAIQKNTNDELNTFKLKVEILEEELRKAIARAEHAEIELQKYKNNANTSTNCLTTSAQTEPLIITPTATAPTPPTPPPPPPLPPPLPTKLIYKQSDDVPGDAATFSDSIIEHTLQKESRSDKIIGTVKQQVQGAATGLDALVKEFKSGRVTLRRNRRKTRTNEALQEMFQVLEISQKQNRNSKICINMQF